jgi:predicted N-acetyltransferase YhbS
MPNLSFVIVALRESDLPAVEKLDDRAFGPGRFAKTAYRLRERVKPDFDLSCVARVGTLLVGANRMTRIAIGAAPALLLGPLTVDPPFRRHGIGRALMERSITAARVAGHRLVILVGDEPYYRRIGFQRVPQERLKMPGPVDPARLLYLELAEGAFEGVKGSVTRGR